ncbi:hypothetical protein ABN16_11435 [Levilactobacillus koreensis]|uniref:Uncharacterized protein n=1 Tax=Levilactobacillus koreensis TaxID=637971 RepID=A0AAC8UXC7_9LACO|nr:hypothetical protein ABN16_11435 [Levilactobacillus koreensis]
MLIDCFQSHVSTERKRGWSFCPRSEIEHFFLKANGVGRSLFFAVLENVSASRFLNSELKLVMKHVIPEIVTMKANTY